MQQSASPSPAELVSKLAAAHRRGYGRGLPSELDRSFELLATCYAAASADDRDAIREAVPAEARLLLIGFSDRFCVLAERSKEARHLETAALAHSIEDFRHDGRENIVRLALLDHVARKLGEDPDRLLRRAAALSSPKAAAQLEAFVQRKPELKSIRAMRIVEVQTEDGVDYRYR